MEGIISLSPIFGALGIVFVLYLLIHYLVGKMRRKYNALALAIILILLMTVLCPILSVAAVVSLGGDILLVIRNAFRVVFRSVESLPAVLSNFPDALDAVSLPVVLLLLLGFGTYILLEGGKK